MRQRLIALGLTAVLGAAGVAGCGSSDDEATTDAAATTAATTAAVPEGKLAASAAPPRLGVYAGVDCGSASSHECEEASELGREGYHAYCRGGVPIKGKRDYFEHKHHEFNFVCFRLSSANTLVDFHYADAKIVRQVHVSSDRFHETCDNGYCISGEWFSTRRMSGQIRNPNHVRADYRAELVG
jgi:hypothetical protein